MARLIVHPTMEAYRAREKGSEMIASSYPLLDVFWTTLIFVGFFLWIWIAIAIFSDIFRSHDMGGFAKAMWIVGIFILPLFGCLLYLIVRGRKMREHAVESAEAQEQATQQYIKSVAGNGTTSSAEEISKLAALRDSGALSEEEFQSEKQKVLAQSS